MNAKKLINYAQVSSDITKALLNIAAHMDSESSKLYAGADLSKDLAVVSAQLSGLSDSILRERATIVKDWIS